MDPDKPLISFDSFEDLRPGVHDEELEELFGKNIKLEKEDATFSDLINEKGGVIFNCTVNSAESSDCESDLSFEDDQEKSNSMHMTGDQIKPETLLSTEVPSKYEEQILEFDVLIKKMISLRSDDKLMKRLLRNGTGEIISKGSFVTFHFNAYRDNEDTPFDSSLLRKQPWKARLGRGDLIIGLEESLMSMRKNEKAQFIIHYDLAYGVLGCPPRVPERALLMYEITVEDFLEEKVADLMEFQNNKDADFDIVLKAALKDHAIGIEFFKKNSYRPAISSFRNALRRLENCEKIKDEEESKQQQHYLLKLYLNLAICYNKESVNEPQKTCKMCQDALRIEPNNSKAQFHYAKALVALGDYKEAKRRFMQAKLKSPDDELISLELVKLQEKAARADAREKDMARNMFKNTCKKQTLTESEISLAGTNTESNKHENPFKTEVEMRLDKFVTNQKMKRLQFPSTLTFTEISTLQKEAHKRKLSFSKINSEFGVHYNISKLEK